MQKSRSALCALCLALLIPLLIRAGRVLPPDSQPLVAEKYAGWSGVLRLWVCEGWQSGSGSLTGWLNRCVARFEKAHPGVYVQPQAVDADAITAFADSGIQPPDMLLFAPGMLASPKGLVALAVPDGLRPELARCGTWGDALYAMPVAMGGYAWAWNRARLDGIPGTWRDSDATSDAPDAADAPVAPVAPPSELYRNWGAALLALCSGRYAAAGDRTHRVDDVERSDVDLGLAGAPTPAPSPTAAPDATTLPCRLPEGFAFDANAWTRFINGEAAAMPVTQREVRRLEALSGQGRGPDWQLSPGGAAFTDQLLCLSLVWRDGADEQRALCRAFLEHLLSDACQGTLDEAGAFSVTDAPSGYVAGDPLARMEAALRAPGLVAPNCFDQTWPETADSIVRLFVEDAAESSALWRRLTELLAKNPNISS